MTDRSKVIFDNKIPKKAVRKAEKSKRKFARKFGDDSGANYAVKLIKNECLTEPLGVYDIRVNEGESDIPFDTEKGIIVGNIRMGFGHYRISMAMASAAHALGYTPYWMDLNSYPDTTCTKIIGAQNDLYSMGSRLSQKSKLFNKMYWEPLNYEGFRQLTYNSGDQKNAELMAPVFKNIPKDIPVIGTHVWPAQAALHAGMKYVVNAIPDNWPMALHFAEGSVHTVQTHQAYMGYRILNGMAKDKVLGPMPADSLVYTGHYIDHELAANIEEDCDKRIARKKEGKPMRLLLTIGGAGAQRELFAAVIKHLMPQIKQNKVVLYVNVGDYQKAWKEICKKVSELKKIGVTHFNDWKDTNDFAQKAIDGDVTGVHAFCHENIFEAVYCTNLLMRSCDVLLTKPSELAFYPLPKLFLKRIGGHEKWGAIHSAEMGDGTLECEDLAHTIQMVDLFINESDILIQMCEQIKANKKLGLYDGAYRAVELAFAQKNKK
ncbi:MAG: hypothetical protein IJL87_08930 [Clostridia bacterium]|nr:hypothetical protein [Clostridia bacterium]